MYYLNTTYLEDYKGQKAAFISLLTLLFFEEHFRDLNLKVTERVPTLGTSTFELLRNEVTFGISLFLILLSYTYSSKEL
jgi:hypothetical protein